MLKWPHINSITKPLLLLLPPFLLLLSLTLLRRPSTAAPFFLFPYPTTTSDDDPLPPPPSNSSWESQFPQPRTERIAVCLVGGARRFELTGPSLIERVVNVFEDADLFLHSPFDKDAYKLAALNAAKRIVGVRIFVPTPIKETEKMKMVLTLKDSPKGLQGLLQYFNLVEGCLAMIDLHQEKHNFTYDWIVRTRVDGYWSGPLTRNYFVPGTYVVPLGSRFYGLNDRFGVGDYNTSRVALSRLGLIPQLYAAGHRQLNSESAFRAQLTVKKVKFRQRRLPFCVVSDRKYAFPPRRYGVPVASISSQADLSGAKCRPCRALCKGKCAEVVLAGLDRGWSWFDGSKGGVELCDAKGEWGKDWEGIFDKVAGEKFAEERRRIKGMNATECVAGFEDMMMRAELWEAPLAEEICGGV